jgi:hypothetical protein
MEKKSYLFVRASAPVVSYDALSSIRERLERLGFADVRLSVASEGELSAKLIPEFVLAVVCRAFRVSEGEVCSRSREERLALARHAYCALAMEYTGLTLQEVGALTGRDHSTVLCSTRKSRELLYSRHYSYCAPYNAAREKILMLTNENKKNGNHSN